MHIRAPFFCPGHAAGALLPGGIAGELGGCYAIDFPELPAIGGLTDTEGPIYEAQRLYAEWCGARYTRFLVNGATSGVHAALIATLRPGDEITMERNVHISSINAVILTGAKINFIYDGTIPTKKVRVALVVSPTYTGVVKDVAKWKEVADVLIVDEAHGSHFYINDGDDDGGRRSLPRSSLECGADIVVQSAHKTLPVLTQAAVLHVASEKHVASVDKALRVVQTTSPSAILLASLDASRAHLETHGAALVRAAVARAQHARDIFRELGILRTYDPGTVFDPLRITLDVANGFELDEELIDSFGVYAELPTNTSLTFVLSLATTDAHVAALVDAVRKISPPPPRKARTEMMEFGRPTPEVSVREAYFAESEEIPAADAVGRISSDTLYPYPPGIPAIIPGETFTRGVVEFLQGVLRNGGTISGGVCAKLEKVAVVREWGDGGD